MARTKNDAGVEQRLDMVIRLLAALLTKEATKKDAVLTLSGLGFAPAEVAVILGTSANYVSVTLYAAKKRPKARRGTKT